MKVLRLLIPVALSISMLAACTAQNQVLLPPPGSTVSFHVYVSDFNNPGMIRILVGPLTNASTASGTLTGANDPAQMALDASHRLFVPNFGGNVIQVFAPPISNGSTPAFTIADSHQPEDVTLDGGGNLYVATINQHVDVFTQPLSGTSTIAFSIPLAGGADGRGVAFDVSGNLYANTSIGVQKFMPPFSGSSTPSATFGPSGNIHGIAFDASGNLFVAASSTTIDVFTPPFTNSSTKSFTITVPASFDYFAFDSSNNLYVPTVTSNLVVYSPPYSGSSSPSVTVPLSGLSLPGVAIGP